MTASRTDLPVAAAGPEAGPGDITEADLDAYRRELTGYAYRMLGSGADADDAVQDALVRAWKALDRFEGRSSLRSWLYRITTNVCLDQLNGRKRRERPMDLGPATTTAAPVLDDSYGEAPWVQPIAEGRVLPTGGDPAEVTAARETIRLAFVAALQHLPARQRAVLILREVLRWQASEVAELLDTSVASVNSALQRARATMAEHVDDQPREADVDSDQADLLARYVDAFERYDVETLVTLLHDDVVFDMPPHPMWLQGPVEVSRWLLGPGIGCRGSRLLASRANGCAAFASYHPPVDGVRHPFSIQLVEVDGDKIGTIHNFLYPELFPSFGFPMTLPADA